jgi:hypothetical protein
VSWCSAFLMAIGALVLIAAGFAFLWEHDGR